jgi:hypothetical protein
MLFNLSLLVALTCPCLRLDISVASSGRILRNAKRARFAMLWATVRSSVSDPSKTIQTVQELLMF